MRVNELSAGRQWLIRLETDGDLYGQILGAARDLGVEAATLTVLGAVQRAALRSYNQITKEYLDFEFDQELELLGGTGNISIKDGEPFLHCHVTLGTKDGKAYGGHLHETKPTVVFVGEVWMQELLGEPPVRLLDERCGLALWS
jgi:uncharacterized protein